MAARMQRREREFFGLLQLSVGANFTLDYEPTDKDASTSSLCYSTIFKERKKILAF